MRTAARSFALFVLSALPTAYPMIGLGFLVYGVSMVSVPAAWITLGTAIILDALHARHQEKTK